MTLSYRRIPQAKIDWDTYPVVGDKNGPGSRRYSVAGGGGEEDTAAREVEQAYSTGYQAGRRECVEEMAGKVDQEVRAFTSMLDDLVSQRQRLVSDSEEAVVRLSCQIARRIVGKAVEVNDKIIVDVVKDAIRHLADKQKLIIRVNPADLEAIESHEPEWMMAAGAGTAVKVKGDPRVKRGGCLVEGESGNVEAQIDRQIEVLERALVEVVR